MTHLYKWRCHESRGIHHSAGRNKDIKCGSLSICQLWPSPEMCQGVGAHCTGAVEACLRIHYSILLSYIILQTTLNTLYHRGDRIRSGHNISYIILQPGLSWSCHYLSSVERKNYVLGQDKRKYILGKLYNLDTVSFKLNSF